MEDERTSNMDSLRHDVQDIKEMIRKLYKQIDSYDSKRVELLQDFDNLKRANKDYEMKVKDLNDIFRNPPKVRVYSETTGPHKYIDRLDTHSYSYESTRSSRSSSPAPGAYRRGSKDAVFHDYDDDDDDLSDVSDDQTYDDRTFTKSIDNFEIDDTSEAWGHVTGTVVVWMCWTIYWL